MPCGRLALHEVNPNKKNKVDQFAISKVVLTHVLLSNLRQ